MAPAFERAKTFRALDRVTTVIGSGTYGSQYYYQFVNDPRMRSGLIGFRNKCSGRMYETDYRLVYVCGPIKDAVNISDYLASNDLTIVNN
jgi:hypothetical protein